VFPNLNVISSSFTKRRCR